MKLQGYILSQTSVGPLLCGPYLWSLPINYIYIIAKNVADTPTRRLNSICRIVPLTINIEDVKYICIPTSALNISNSL